MSGFPINPALLQFEADRSLAEGQRQQATSGAVAAGGSNQIVAAKVRAADIAYHRAVSASGQRNGVRVDNQQALRDLGAA